MVSQRAAIPSQHCPEFGKVASRLDRSFRSTATHRSQNPRVNSCTATLSAAAILASTSTETLTVPRSTSPRNLGLSSAFSASFSCVSSRPSRKERRLCPNVRRCGRFDTIDYLNRRHRRLKPDICAFLLASLPSPCHKRDRCKRSLELSLRKDGKAEA